MRAETQRLVKRPRVGSDNYMETVYQDLKEYTNDFIKLLVMAYENPTRFFQRGGPQQYMDILSRIERKKSQILYLQDKWAML